MEDETLGIQLTELENKLATNKPPVKECIAWSELYAVFTRITKVGSKLFQARHKDRIAAIEAEFATVRYELEKTVHFPYGKDLRSFLKKAGEGKLLDVASARTMLRALKALLRTGTQLGLGWLATKEVVEAYDEVRNERVAFVDALLGVITRIVDAGGGNLPKSEETPSDTAISEFVIGYARMRNGGEHRRVDHHGRP